MPVVFFFFLFFSFFSLQSTSKEVGLNAHKVGVVLLVFLFFLFSPSSVVVEGKCLNEKESSSAGAARVFKGGVHVVSCHLPIRVLWRPALRYYEESDPVTCGCVVASTWSCEMLRGLRCEEMSESVAVGGRQVCWISCRGVPSHLEGVSFDI